MSAVSAGSRRAFRAADMTSSRDDRAFFSGFQTEKLSRSKATCARLLLCSDLCSSQDHKCVLSRTPRPQRSPALNGRPDPQRPIADPRCCLPHVCVGDFAGTRKFNVLGARACSFCAPPLLLLSAAILATCKHDTLKEKSPTTLLQAFSFQTANVDFWVREGRRREIYANFLWEMRASCASGSLLQYLPPTSPGFQTIGKKLHLYGSRRHFGKQLTKNGSVVPVATATKTKRQGDGEKRLKKGLLYCGTAGYPGGD